MTPSRHSEHHCSITRDITNYCMSMRMILVVGLLHSPLDVFTSTTRTKPSAPGYVFSIRPIGQVPRGTFGSRSRTTSPSRRFLLTSVHFCRACRVGRYSCTQRRQNSVFSCCNRRQRCRRPRPSSLAEGVVSTLDGPVMKSPGVSGGWSFGSDETFVRGRVFSSPSALQNAVCSSSSVRSARSNVFTSAFFATFTSASHTPLKWGAPGGLKIHFVRFLESSLCTSSLSSSWTSFFSSFAALTKFLPLSDLISVGLPRREMNRIRARMKLAVSSEYAISRCAALVCRHAKMHR